MSAWMAATSSGRASRSSIATAGRGACVETQGSCWRTSVMPVLPRPRRARRRAARRPRRSPASVMVSGGSSRTTVFAVRLTSSPRSRAASTTGAASTVEIEAPHQAARRAPRGPSACFAASAEQPASRGAGRRGRRARARRRRAAGRGSTAPPGRRAGCRRRCCRDRRARAAPATRLLTSAAPTGTPRAERLADRDQVGPQPEHAEVERVARCGRGRTALRRTMSSAPVRAHASLHGVGERRRQRTHAALALDRLDDDRRGLAGDRRVERGRRRRRART